MTNHILNKKVEKGKVNDLSNLKGVVKEAWNFISAFYNMGWDMLIANSNGSSFRNKVVAKFTPKINILNAPKGNNDKSVDKPASINRIPPSILVKSSKKVNEITKYFKKKQSIERKDEVICSSNYSFNQQH